MFRQPGISSPTLENIFPSPRATLRYIAPSTHKQYGNEHGGSGEIQSQQTLLIPASIPINASPTLRSRRTGPLSPAGKIKAAAVRKKVACFRCAALRIGCNGTRPCTERKKVLQPSKRARKLSWMKCIVHTVSTYSIYISDSDVSESPMPIYLHTLNSMLNQVQIPSNLQTLDLDFLAADYAGWISHATSSIPTSKLGLLCTSDFQSIAGHGLGDDFVKDFRFLLGATSLFYTAMSRITHPKDETVYTTALCNLEKLIGSRGNRVVRRLDQLCHPGVIKNMPPAQCKLLFLVVIGMCLSASYMFEKSERVAVSLTAASTHSGKVAYEQSRTFIAALAHVATYIGHLSDLFPSNVNSSAIVDAAQRRWDKNGSYTWQIPPALSKRLTKELLAQEPLAYISQSLGQQGQSGPGSSATPVQGGQEHTENASPHQQASNNECEDCLQNDGLCAFCEFMDLPDTPYIDISIETPLPIEEIFFEPDGDALFNAGSSAIDMGMSETRLPIPSDNHGDLIRIPERRYWGGYLWYCCECQDGPHLHDIEVACCACEHKICDACSIGFV